MAARSSHGARSIFTKTATDESVAHWRKKLWRKASATRDLQDLVEKGALIRKGELKHTRYFLALKGTYGNKREQERNRDGNRGIHDI